METCPLLHARRHVHTCMFAHMPTQTCSRCLLDFAVLYVVKSHPTYRCRCVKAVLYAYLFCCCKLLLLHSTVRCILYNEKHEM